MIGYSYSLLFNIGKVYDLPSPSSAGYKQIRADLCKLMIKIKTDGIGHDEYTKLFKQFISKFKSLDKISYFNDNAQQDRITIITTMMANRSSPSSILDIGSGKYSTDTCIKNHYQLTDDQVFALDDELPDVDGITPITYSEGKIPLDDASIDLIFLFNKLHLMDNFTKDAVMEEITRVLSPNGVIIIRDHDYNNHNDLYIFLNLLHIFWSLAYNEVDTQLHLMSRTETQKFMSKHGLKSEKFINYKNHNNQRIYHEMYGRV